MATLNQLRTRIDNWLVTRWPLVVSRQNTYFANNGHYWQGLITHTDYPSHTTDNDNDIIANNLNTHPSDQVASWLNVFSELDGITFPAALNCSVYETTNGKGYVVSLYVKFNDVIYSRSKNVGPLSELTQPWHIYV